MRIGVFAATAVGLALAACAGRDPEPIAIVQPQDQTSTCTMISAEIQANNVRVKELADEQGLKVAQNVVAGVSGHRGLAGLVRDGCEGVSEQRRSRAASASAISCGVSCRALCSATTCRSTAATASCRAQAEA
jgi:hypothetical protein